MGNRLGGREHCQCELDVFPVRRSIQSANCVDAYAEDHKGARVWLSVCFISIAYFITGLHVKRNKNVCVCTRVRACSGHTLRAYGTRVCGHL